MKKNQLPFRDLRAINDREVIFFINNILKKINIFKILNNSKIHDTFLNEYFNWINSSKLNKLYNLKKFKHKCYSNGSSQSLDYFYLKHNKKRLRFFKNDYVYHYLSARNNLIKWEYLGKKMVKKGDAVIISMPFSDTGSKHPDMEKIINECNKKNVPVLIDCCYYSMCKGINFDFNNKSIETVVFSLSKAFPVSRLRIGMRLSKIDDDDQLFYYQKLQFVNKLSLYIGLKIIRKFSFDYLYKKYSGLQNYYCKKMNLTPSNVVAIALGGNKWKGYNRGGTKNRICLSSLLEKK